MQALSKALITGLVAALGGSRDPKEITPSDSTPLDPPPRALLVCGTGDLVIKNASGDTVTIPIAAAPIELNIQPTHVLEATDIDDTIIGYW